MSRNIFLLTLILMLAGCPGGLRTRLISTASLEPPSGESMLQVDHYEESLIAPSFIIDGHLYLQLYSSNVDNLGYESGLEEYPHHTSIWMSAAREDIQLDASSIVLVNDKAGEEFRPIVLMTSKRKMVDIYGRDPYLVCRWIGVKTEKITGIAHIPKFAGNKWPPKDYDESVFCLRLDFGASIADIPPTGHYQLKFSYLVAEQRKDVTLYLYPLQYKVFEH